MSSKRSSSPVEAPSNEATGEDNPTPSQNPPTTDVSGLAAQLIEEAPEPQPHAIAQATAERAEAAEDAKDSAGTLFDPELHTGTQTKDGLWRKRAGRKAGGANAPRPKLNLPGGNAKTSESASPGNEAKVAEARATGVAAANLFLMFSVAIGGEEWQPRNENEKPMLEQGFAAYFESQQWTDLPPWLGLCACIGMYALPRFAMPKTKERAKGVRNWFVGKYIDWKAARAKKRHERQFGPETAVERADRNSREAYAREVAGLHTTEKAI